ncbi:hypothetical protein BZG36_00433 [Bifiguratus adelaidae]|uniref:THUMP domain-containing protein n=1 Tax=Bifiguratus adelaidae TaxID=1938954 RepID=A0A261Y8D0_9FUNG|nr:hypothetical protein BZG36_00433 [Bifiguratus adelaidae]
MRPQGTFWIKSFQNGRCLDVKHHRGNKIEPGTAIIMADQLPASADSTQLFRHEDGYLVHVASGLVLDYYQGSVDKATHWAFTGIGARHGKDAVRTLCLQPKKGPNMSQTQRWEFDHYNHIYLVDDPLQVMDIRGGRDEEGASVIIYSRKPQAEASNQLWGFEMVGGMGGQGLGQQGVGVEMGQPMQGQQGKPQKVGQPAGANMMQPTPAGGPMPNVAGNQKRINNVNLCSQEHYKVASTSTARLSNIEEAIACPYSISACGSMMETSGIFRSSSEETQFAVDRDVVERSVLLKHMLADVGESDLSIPLPNVSAPILSKVIEYCTHHRHDPPAVDNGPSYGGKNPSGETNLTIDDWDNEFCRVDQGTLFELILAANYLDIKPLLDLTCKTVANMIKGKSPEEIRKHFNIVNDFTSEEEEQESAQNVTASFGIQPGMSGVYITCDRNKEQRCTREMIEMFSEYADQMYEFPEDTEDKDDKEEIAKEDDDDGPADIEAVIAKELAAEKESKDNKKATKRRFVGLATGMECMIFIKTQSPIEPVPFVTHIIKDLVEKRQRRTRIAHRLVPITQICAANFIEIERVCGEMCDEVFGKRGEDGTRRSDSKTFAIQPRIRQSNKIDRDELIKQVAKIVGMPHKVDLNNPEYSIIVEVWRNVCGMAIVRDYQKLQRFNLQTLLDEATSAQSDGTSRKLKDASEAVKQYTKLVEPEASKRIYFIAFDLASLDSVRDGAREFFDLDLPLHVLINNAGYTPASRKATTPEYTKDTRVFEKSLMINFVGPMLFTELLIPKMMESGGRKILNVASSMHDPATKGLQAEKYNDPNRLILPLDNLDGSKFWDGTAFYRVSKLADIWWTYVLAERAAKSTSEITVTTFCPGLVPTTNMARDFPLYLRIIARYLMPLHPSARSLDEAGNEYLAYATSPEFAKDNGVYYRQGKQAKSSAESHDMVKARTVWNKACDVIGMPDHKVEVA